MEGTDFKDTLFADEDPEEKLIDIFIFPCQISFMHCLTFRPNAKLLKKYLKLYKSSVVCDYHSITPV